MIKMKKYFKKGSFALIQLQLLGLQNSLISHFNLPSYFNLRYITELDTLLMHKAALTSEYITLNT